MSPVISPTNPVATSQGPCACCNHCFGTWQAQGVQSVDPYSAGLRYFDPQPAGLYRVVYLGGAVRFWGGNNLWLGVGASVVVFSNGASSATNPRPAFASAEDAQADGLGITIEFQHTGGSIGLYFADNYFQDNSVGPLGPPRWELQRCVAGGGV